ncbi:hypothetical protein [Arthrobacter methylotrophus]|uniref:hypothetical protein n=1 Tax=Arthrobacter methylotrophus TaxID=121291 RepID=UPI0031F11819
MPRELFDALAWIIPFAAIFTAVVIVYIRVKREDLHRPLVKKGSTLGGRRSNHGRTWMGQ